METPPWNSMISPLKTSVDISWHRIPIAIFDYQRVCWTCHKCLFPQPASNGSTLCMLIGRVPSTICAQETLGARYSPPILSIESTWKMKDSKPSWGSGLVFVLCGCRCISLINMFCRCRWIKQIQVKNQSQVTNLYSVFRWLLIRRWLNRPSEIETDKKHVSI